MQTLWKPAKQDIQRRYGHQPYGRLFICAAVMFFLLGRPICLEAEDSTNDSGEKKNLAGWQKGVEQREKVLSQQIKLPHPKGNLTRRRFQTRWT
jgi:hypothetical protein